MNQYVAFLRGINVGGKTIKMDLLRKTLEASGFENVKTLLARGKVVFEAKKNETAKIKSEIEAQIKKAFSLDVRIILRNAKEIQSLLKSDPFKGIKVTPQTRLYVTFLSDEPKYKPSLPHRYLDGDYEILQVTGNQVISVVTLSPEHGTTDAMAILEKEFGANITTRNWNTIQKLKGLID